jgi:hypothetical protein
MKDESKNRYNPKDDPQFQKPFTDIDEWRERDTGVPVRYQYIHGGFEGTGLRFSFYFPVKDDYRGRFFHFVAPMQGSENASQALEGMEGIEDKIAFALTHGAYFVETNMGVAGVFGPLEDPAVIYRASAAAAEYSREIAARLYGPHRPFGYICGGSGGGFKSISCFESTNTWDGAAPFVIGSPMAIPNCFTVRAHAKRVLRNKMPQIVDAVEPGGGDMYVGLNTEEREALEEAMRMGFPPRSWFYFARNPRDDGALPVLAPSVKQIDPAYFEEFWKLPGYLGADPTGSARRDRIQHRAAVMDVHVPRPVLSPEDAARDEKTGVDDAWHRLLRGDTGLDSMPWIELESLPRTGYFMGLNALVQTGRAAPYRFTVERFEDRRIVIATSFGDSELLERLSALKRGDEIILDNSDYIAIQTFHRHQVPDRSFTVWDQFRDKDGNPRYPQRPLLIGPLIAKGGAGSLQSGNFSGKMITVAAMMDADALPWQPDWYRSRVKENLGEGEREEDKFRLWYIDNALHGDTKKTGDPLHVVNYLGALYQALLDLSDWVERGIAPPATTNYTLEDGQLATPATARERWGVQPVIRLLVNGTVHAKARPGEEVRFTAEAEVPPGAGKLVSAEWSFEGEEDFLVMGEFTRISEDSGQAVVERVHRFEKPGTYFPVLRVTSNRLGSKEDIFTQVKNLCRVRVTVSEPEGE